MPDPSPNVSTLTAPDQNPSAIQAGCDAANTAIAAFNNAAEPRDNSALCAALASYKSELQSERNSIDAAIAAVNAAMAQANCGQ